MNGKKDLIICRCEEVTEEEIREAIRNGASDVDAVKRTTRAGMGLCQSHLCYQLIASIIYEMTGKPLAEIFPQTVRPPVRPIPAEILAKKS
ncbi:Hydrogen cyanide synthase subunit HcnB [subsurface metagenome]